MTHIPTRTETRIIVRLVVEGVHRWLTCPLPEVQYLRKLHRHLFHVIATKPVAHQDRDIEFIKLGHEIREYLSNRYYHPDMRLHSFDDRSCEMIATELLQTFGLDGCEVSEDGENGALVEVIPCT